MVLNVVGSNPIGHPSSNPLQLCVVRDFLSIYLLPLSLLAVRPLNRGATSLRSLPTLGAFPFLVSRLCCRRCACRTVALDRKVPPALLVRSHTCPSARGCRKRFAPLHRRMRSGAKRLLGWGSDAPAPMRFSKRLSGLVETYISSRAGARAHTAIFRFLPSPFTFLRKVQ